ncbi:MAG: lysoplasmalogenase [Acidimicrobiales bacterium]|nr:lysoplasmalogenase [Acidimicrobiales bacterium]
MNATTLLLLSLTLVCAVGDWVAVHAGRRAGEYVFKPLTMVVLIAAALALDPDSDAQRAAFVVALVLSLAGDVFLMLAHEREDLFVYGLASFLVGHVAYVVGFVLAGLELEGVVTGLVVVAVAALALARRIVAGVRTSRPELATPVTAYIAVISAMVVCAFGVVQPLAVLGALLFYASDAAIAWTSFIAPKPWGRLFIITTYHVAQILLVVSLV